MKKYIAIVLSLATMMSSCSDFLAEENKTQYSVDYIYGSTEG